MNLSIVLGISGLFLCGKGLEMDHGWYNRNFINGTNFFLWGLI
jgi:hypothetical protein